MVLGDGVHGPLDGAQPTGTEESDQALASDAVRRLERVREMLAAVRVHWVVVLGEQMRRACLRVQICKLLSRAELKVNIAYQRALRGWASIALRP